jgi:hypothetical protein
VHERDATDHLTEVARVLLEAASEIHAESHPIRAFAPGALLSLPAPAQRAGVDTGRPTATMPSGSWSTRAPSSGIGERTVRQGNKHYVIHPARPGRRRTGPEGRGPRTPKEATPRENRRRTRVGSRSQ